MVTTLKTKLPSVQERDENPVNHIYIVNTQELYFFWDLFYLNSAAINTYLGKQCKTPQADDILQCCLNMRIFLLTC